MNVTLEKHAPFKTRYTRANQALCMNKKKGRKLRKGLI